MDLSLSANNMVIGFPNYIPVGCLRLLRSDCDVSSDLWGAHTSQWIMLVLPRDLYAVNQPPGTLENTLQTKLMDSPVLAPLHGLHSAAWIRFSFKANDLQHGQVRVYILPEDVGHLSINRNDRNLRKRMALLLSQIDIARSTFLGHWDIDTPVSSPDPALQRSEKDDPSLFYIFNHLPSPGPNLKTVEDIHAKDAMYKILASDVEGLKTTLYQYQRRSAALMIQREAQPAQNIDPRLTLVHDQDDQPYYWDFGNSCCFREPRRYEAAKGGILAETMGLGKTLICLSLILATLDIPSQIPVEHSVNNLIVRPKTGTLAQMAAANLSRSGLPWKAEFARIERETGYDLTKSADLIRKSGYYEIIPPPPRRTPRRSYISESNSALKRKIWLSNTTLVIVPSNLVQQWRQEIKKHTTGLKVLYMNDLKASIPPAEALRDYDILLFSKQRFEKESKDSMEDGNVSRSPLQDIQIKRLVVDEGHTFGNASNSSRTEALTVLGSLQVASRWIVSGTPTQGLYGMEAAKNSSKSQAISQENLEDSIGPNLPNVQDDSSESVDTGSTSSEISSVQENLFYKQERKDLEKLGNIATFFLKARPWANASNDLASWNQLVMQPRHGSKSRGNMDCLRATLEGLIIRHRADDILEDVVLPPLYQKVVKLEGSVQNKLSLNTFALMIITNAVTSERKDADYFFHPRQRKSLMQLVSNLRSASFFWSGFEEEHLTSTIDNAMGFLGKREVKISSADEDLLCQAIRMGRTVLTNEISLKISRSHEMPFYIENNWPDDIRKALSLDDTDKNPTLIGATFLHKAQQMIESQLGKENPLQGLLEAIAKFELKPRSDEEREVKSKKKTTAPMLAGGVTIGKASASRPVVKSNTASTNRLLESELSQTFGSVISNSDNAIHSPLIATENKAMVPNSDMMTHAPLQSALQLRLASDPNPDQSEPNSQSANKLKSILKQKEQNSIPPIDRAPLESTHIISTASAKLSYLMDKIILYQSTEKILVFYESDNVAYYIAQALECLGIKHLIYAKSLSSSRRSQYVVSFNQSPIFRVLLMDVSQAAFGLDISSASRVFFVNPVFSPQVEAQAVKRAHRIGQTRPVHVETLVLKGSIEEVILERRKAMTNEEHNRCKNILDDQTMFDWIRNVRFIDVDADAPGPMQMTPLEVMQQVRSGAEAEMDPDEDLVVVDESPKGKGKEVEKGEMNGLPKLKLKLKLKHNADTDDDESNPETKRVRFS